MNNEDVELNALLGIQDSADTTTAVSSNENSENEVTPSPVDSAEAEPKITEREKSRARDLANRVRELEQELAKKNSSQVEQEQPADLDGFLSQINDEGTRTLLKEYGKVMRSEIEKQYSPVLSTYKEEKFEKEFAQFSEKLPNLSLHKEDLKKEFTRNPNADLKGLIGSRVVDILSSRIKPLESQGAQSPRDEQKLDLDSASKEDLYAMLKARKNN